MAGSGLEAGYYRFPTIHGDTIVFVSEDDLWTVEAAGGTARRLTSGLGEATSPSLSRDGRWLAFIGRDEGHPEVYVMPAGGGRAVRRTFLGSTIARVAGWSPDGRRIIFASNAAVPMMRIVQLQEVDREGGLAQKLPFGPAHYVSFGPKGMVLGRHGMDPWRWKRYRGGMVGQLWIDREGNGRFDRLVETGGNSTNPMWIGGRIYFQSDHEGVGNLYSVSPDGKGLRRHTKHQEFTLRNPSSDGRRIAYTAGSNVFVFDPESDEAREVEIDLASPRTQRNRRFVDAGRYLQDYDPHPKEPSAALTVRGKAFTLGNWEGAVVQHGRPDGARYRLARWLADGKRFAAITDETGEETIAIFSADGSAKPRLLKGLPIGRAVDMEASPAKDQLIVANHRFELLWIDLGKGAARVMDKSKHDRISGLAWSPDGRWVAYGFQETLHQSVLRIIEPPGGRPRNVTRALLRDAAPAFDPDGKYLYFLSYREFDPVYDSIHFELGFPRGMRPYLALLRKELRSPFDPPLESGPDGKEKKKIQSVKIDLGGIEDRLVPFPVPEGRYGQIQGIPGAAIFSSYEIEGSLGQTWVPGEAEANGTLHMYKFEDQKRETLVGGITSFQISRDSKTILYRTGNRLRAIKAGEKPPDKPEPDAPPKKAGWIDLGRVRVSVDPGSEWRQMFHEAWRLMRDHFWLADMSGVDWGEIRERYRPLVERVATRSEFSDLVWETQGELGTSHCYEAGGDYRPEPRYDVGMLAAETVFDSKRGGYRITRIIRGDPWDPEARSPLAAPGLGIGEGDVITAVDGRPVASTVPPQELLVNHAGQEVMLALAGGRKATVRTLRSEYPARYREWVDSNRSWVHKRSGGRAGYVHVPDMGPRGFAEFHRQYLAEVDRDGLLVDVRFNGGGHVSQLLLEKLARRRIGYDVQRWGPPSPYPGDSPAGPLVALTNEQAGSDGDIFSHGFKLFGLGPLVGRRTWGGVIGIWPRHALADGSVTTQPEFSFWFRDVGFGVENHGTEPDVDVEIAPHDYAAGRDPQLERALEILLEALRKNPPKLPKFEPRPRR